MLVKDHSNGEVKTMMDVEGETIIVRESEIEDSGFAALVVCTKIEAESK